MHFVFLHKLRWLQLLLTLSPTSLSQRSMAARTGARHG
ncbi:hypothetical protein SMAC4_14079 [Sordaria macrospora]|nr:hypothetical protein SMAC4_14079 [Sordaria macrospora]